MVYPNVKVLLTLEDRGEPQVLHLPARPTQVVGKVLALKLKNKNVEVKFCIFLLQKA